MNKAIQPQIIRSAKRKSISIQVDKNCSVIIRAPQWISQAKIVEILKSKNSWIEKKIHYFQQRKDLGHKPKEYIDGESFYYLGQLYVLKIITADKNYVERINSTLFIYKNNKTEAKIILSKWFNMIAFEVFSERLEINFQLFAKQYQYPKPSLKIRTMKSRWGSMSNLGAMTLNSKLIHPPVECLDYVIMHELCHLNHKNHGKYFYQMQETLTPQWKEIKHLLNNKHWSPE